MKYYIGLDIGTNSVGWAVTDENYKVLKFKGNRMWGVSLFDEAHQAAERRTFRTSRRRNERRKQRILLLQELFAPIINKIDENFYIRLKESKLYLEDKCIADKYNVFNDEGYTDIEYHKDYPTIHHLISKLMNSDEKFDSRLVYLACAYILSHRGHFLIEVDKNNIAEVKNIEYVYDKFLNWFDTMEIEHPFECLPQDFGKVLKENKGIKTRENEFKRLLFNGKKPDDTEYPIDRSVMLKLIAGGKAKLSVLFKNKVYENLENDDICLGSADFDDKFENIANELNDGDMDLILVMKAVYDWSLLAEILKGKNSISEAKVEIYNSHKSDLRLLKYIIKKYVPDKYDEVFRQVDGSKNNYTKYSKNIKSSEEVNYSKFDKESDAESFCKYIKNIIKDIKVKNEDLESFELLKLKAETNELCPKQVNTNNRVIPYQLYYAELKKILDNAKKYIPELNETDEYGSVADKILSIMTFRIPYYVGPLVDKNKSNYAWMVRKSAGRILPWNFDDMVDKDKSEDEFIRRMTCQCTYVAGEDVIPKNSLLYCKYTVLNEINSIKINQHKISPELKQYIYTDLFEKNKKVTKKSLEQFLISNGCMTMEDKLEGVDININSSLKSYHDFKRLLSNKILTEKEVEDIISRITITTDKARLRAWLSREYNLSKEDIKYILGLNYKDYGRLSKKFLTEIYDVDDKTGEIKNPNIITMLWETNNNIMELLSENYNYNNQLQIINSAYYEENPKTISDRLNDMYISNAVKRPIIRTIDILNEIKKIKGGAPEKIFIEMARDNTGKLKGKRTKSRKETIREFLNGFDFEDREKLLSELEGKTDDQLRGEKLYLYFMQLGKCMYSGKSIDIEYLSTKAYDIDHIYPQSKIKDDSLDNKVLVLSELNGEKGDVYPIKHEIRDKMRNMWAGMHHNKLISDKKYERLTRSTPFTDEELAGFINRQLVETRQSTKAVASIIKDIMPETEVVYVKAGLVSEFRHDFDMLKCREINDLHHAKDAYLNIVLGNVYNVKFTKNPINFIRELKINNENGYSMKLTSLLKHNICRGNQTAWIGTKNKDGAENPDSTIHIVKNTMSKNNIRYVKYAYRRKGGLFNQNPERAAEGLVNLKKSLPSERYGGYNNTFATCFVLVKYFTQKDKGIVLMPLELMYADKFNKDINFAKEYSLNMLKEIISVKKDDYIKAVEFPLGKRLIKINTLLDIDGFKANIVQKSDKGKYIVLAMGLSLIVDKESNDYIKKLISSYTKINDGAKNTLSEEYDKINKVNNLKIYDLLTNKINNHIYSVKLSDIGKKFKDGRNIFISLEPDKQVEALINMLRVLKSGRKEPCDLSLINAKKNSAVIKLKVDLSKLKNIKSIRIIDQSPTGLYEKVSENLLEL